MSGEIAQSNTDVAERTTQIVAAWVGHNAITPAELPALVRSVGHALATLGSEPAAAMAPEPVKPAVPIRRSWSDDKVTCLHCGKSMKSLKRHLRGDHDQTPDEYRASWNLSKDHPIVAPGYSKHRADLAKAQGLGASGPRGREKRAAKRA